MSATAQKKRKALSETKSLVDSDGGWEVYDDRPALTEDEIARLLTTPVLPDHPTDFQRLMHYRDLVLMGLLYDTKARISELCRSTVGDLRRMNTAEPELYIRNPKGKVKWRRLDSEDEAEEGWHLHYRTIRGQRELWGGPTVQEPRYAGVSPRTKQFLDLYLQLRDDGKDRAAPLLISKRGKLTPRGAQFLLREYAVKAGLNIKYRAQTDTDGKEQLRVAVSPHAFREAGERHQLDRGANAKAVAEETGHSVATQQTFYNRVNRASVRNAQRLTNPFYTGIPGESPVASPPAAAPEPSKPAPAQKSVAVAPAAAPAAAPGGGATLLTHAAATVQEVAELQEFALAMGMPLKRVATLESLHPVAAGDVVVIADGGALGASAAARVGALARLQQCGARLYALDEGGEVDLASADAKKRLAAWKPAAER